MNMGFYIYFSSLLFLLWGEDLAHLKHDHPGDESTVNVWLTGGAGVGLSQDIGGQQFNSEIYLYDLRQDRSPIEWAREVAHAPRGRDAWPAGFRWASPEPAACSAPPR